MVDVKVNSLNSLPKTAVNSHVADAVVRPENIENPKTQAYQTKSKGEKIFNWTVYSGLNYWVNLISSIFIADYLTRSNTRGNKYLQRAITNTTNGLVAAHATTSIKKAYHHSKVAWEVISLTSGGWLLLVPLKMMEDRKRTIVHWINDKLGVDQTAPDGHKLTPDEIYIEHEQPKQSWFNVVKRRLYSCFAVVAFGASLEHFAADKSKQIKHEYHVGNEKWIEKHHLGGKERTTKLIVKGVNKGLKYIPGGDVIIASPRAQRWIELLALDTILTKISAVVMHMTNGAKKFDMPHEISENIPTNDSTLTDVAIGTITHPAVSNTVKQWTGKERAASHAHRILSEPKDQALGTGGVSV